MTRLDPRQIVDISQDTGLTAQSRATPAKRVLSATTIETTGSNSEVATNNTTNSKTLVINYNDPPPGSTPQLQILNDPGGNKYELQFNAGNSIFGATNSFTYSPVTGNVSLRGNLIVTGKISGKMTTSTTNFQIVGGSSGQVLATDGAGNLSWTNAVTDIYGNSNVAAYLATYSGDITANTITSTDTAYLYNLSSTGTSSLTTVNIGGNLTMNGGVANLGHVSKLRIDGGAEYDFLQTDGNGHVTWAAIPSAPTLQEVTTTGHITNVAVQFTNNTSSINQSTGAITVTGGIGLGGNVHAQHIHAAGSMYTQDTVYSGQNAIGSSFVNPLFIGKDTGEEYVQSAMVNSNAHGSADFAAYGESGGTDQGWTDMGYAGTEFDDPNYTITKPSDGYLFVEGMPGQGGNLVIATGDLGDSTHRDIIFATGGFLTENEFARIDHANNVFHLTKAGSGIQFEDGTIQTTAGGGGNVGLGNFIFSGNNLLNFNGGSFNNGDLSHGSTARVNLPMNGDSSSLLIENGYGDVSIGTGPNAVITSSWTFDTNGLLTLPSDNVTIGSVLGGDAILANNNPFGVLSQGNSGATVVQWSDDISNTALVSAIYVNGPFGNVGDIQIRTGDASYPNVWTFDNTGALNLTNFGVIRQEGAVNVVATDYAQLQWVDSGNINIPDPNGSGGPKNWAYVDNGGFHVETNLNNGGSSYAWDFDINGNFTTTANIAGGNVVAISNFVGTKLRTNLTDFNWSESITGIATGATTVVTLANNVFGDPWSGQVTITNVVGTTEANATWWYQAVDSNQFALYTDNTLLTPVDSSAWGAYVSGGSAITLDYGNIEINAQTVTIRSDHGDYNNKIWSFNSNGSTIFPTLTVDLHNGGNQTAQTLQFGDTTQQAVITGPTPAPDTAAQRLIIQGQRGNGLGEGGDVYVWAGDAQFNGGDIKIYAGDADDGSAGSGGYINLDGGSGFNGGGQISVTGGYSPGGQGGPVYISAGQGTDGGVVNINGGGASTATGGYVNIQGGFGQNDGGAVTIAGGGSALGLPGYGNVQITAGVSTWAFNNTGILALPDTTLMGAVEGSNTFGFYNPNNTNFLIEGPNNITWSFDTGTGITTLPIIDLGSSKTESSTLRSQRKVIPAYHYSAEIVGSTPTVVYTVTNSSIATMKATMTVQHQGLGFEILDVIASTSSGDTYYTVSNRVKPPTIADTTVSVGLNGSYQMEITMTVNSGASYSWVTYDVTEFGIPVD